MSRRPRNALGSAAGLALLLALSAVSAGTPGCASAPAAAPYTLWYSGAGPSDVAELDPLLQQGLKRVSQALGVPWRTPLTVALVPDRAAFTASFPPESGVDASECTTVAGAVAERLTLLAPRAWGSEACEHDADDHEHVALLLRHELVHALHGQHNPARDVSGLHELVWFVEGLATCASGQLDREHEAEARAALAAGVAPTRLAQAWSGEFREGVCGSLVAFLEEHCGREALQPMLAVTTQSELLAIAGLSEDELLAAWAEWAR